MRRRSSDSSQLRHHIGTAFNILRHLAPQYIQVIRISFPTVTFKERIQSQRDKSHQTLAVLEFRHQVTFLLHLDPENRLATLHAPRPGRGERDAAEAFLHLDVGDWGFSVKRFTILSAEDYTPAIVGEGLYSISGLAPSEEGCRDVLVWRLVLRCILPTGNTQVTEQMEINRFIATLAACSRNQPYKYSVLLQEKQQHAEVCTQVLQAVQHHLQQDRQHLEDAFKRKSQECDVRTEEHARLRGDIATFSLADTNRLKGEIEQLEQELAKLIARHDKIQKKVERLQSGQLFIAQLLQALSSTFETSLHNLREESVKINDFLAHHGVEIP
ncbi:uncharacterized protein BKCO1_33000107 [Diplodia corticola]|uniref:Uncharacterized protein n=1 Tax=Diplodia corticola TaxID=236234 RepID=A0A1J9QXH9_9PEZI|nr:uncharacterized protein BKCO1_33000107 [Diplodia corticola]OJD33096.1 hypothetical protein BKCO1_33000107 [Diplodia corticola]